MGVGGPQPGPGRHPDRSRGLATESWSIASIWPCRPVQPAGQAVGMNHQEAERRAAEWVEAWNSHDLDRILDHFCDDAVFSSPLVPVITGRANPLQGRDEIRAYWAEGLRRLPGLRFELRSVFVGAGTIAIDYRNERRQDCLEVLALADDGRARRGWALYGPRPALGSAGE